jgi:hypothetical protein
MKEKGARASQLKKAEELATTIPLFCTNSACDKKGVHNVSNFPLPFPLHFRKNDFAEVEFNFSVNYLTIFILCYWFVRV